MSRFCYSILVTKLSWFLPFQWQLDDLKKLFPEIDMDEFLFEPHGYSMNGFSHDVSGDELSVWKKIAEGLHKMAKQEIHFEWTLLLVILTFKKTHCSLSSARVTMPLCTSRQSQNFPSSVLNVISLWVVTTQYWRDSSTSLLQWKQPRWLWL